MKKSKIIAVLITIVYVLVVLSNLTLIAGDIYTNPNGFEGQGSGAASDKTMELINIAIGVAQVVATAIAIIMLALLAIKYISAAPSEKADIKKGAVLYIVGAVLLFGATGLLGIIQNFAGGFLSSDNG
jgi:nitric oxide reductase large subunit